MDSDNQSPNNSPTQESQPAGDVVQPHTPSQTPVVDSSIPSQQQPAGSNPQPQPIQQPQAAPQPVNTTQQQNTQQASNEPISQASPFVTTSSGGSKNIKVVLVVVLGLVIVGLLGFLGYYFYNNSVSERNNTNQQLSNPPKPIVLPTREPSPTPTVALSDVNDGQTSACQKALNDASSSALLKLYCQGDFCSEKTTQEDCEAVDVISYSSESATFSGIDEGDGNVDCEWISSGFSSRCQNKY